jgi:DNA-binding transcriptional ArsR family regulator
VHELSTFESALDFERGFRSRGPGGAPLVFHARGVRYAGALSMPSARVDRTLSALADPMRREVVSLLSRGPMRPSKIADALGATRPLVSRHLGVLRHAGMVKEHVQREDARLRMYMLCRAPFVELRSWLDEVEAFWADQLQAFKRHAERRRGP